MSDRVQRERPSQDHTGSSEPSSMVRFTAVSREHLRRGCRPVLLLANCITSVTWTQLLPLQSEENRIYLQGCCGDRINGKVLGNKHKMRKGDGQAGLQEEQD